MQPTPEERNAATEVDAPVVTIGMPVYNGERFIREALDSLLAQTFTKFELIISDNASTDSTASICCEYARRDRRIRYIRQPENRGVFRNVSFVIEEARGKYFMLVGDDDVYDENYLCAMLRLFDGSETIGLAYSNYSFVDEMGNHRSSNLKTFFSPRHSKFQNILRYVRGRYCLPMMMGLFRTDILQKALPIPHEYLSPMTGDVDNLFLLKILTLAKIASTSRVLFHYRLKDRSAALPVDWPKGFKQQQLYILRHSRKVGEFIAETIRLSDFSMTQKHLLLAWNRLILIYLFTYYFMQRLTESVAIPKIKGTAPIASK